MLNIILQPFPVLETARLRLRQFTREDAPDFFILRTNDSAMKYLDMLKLPSEAATLELIERINNYWKENTAISWVITFKDDPTLIGTILYKTISKEHHRAEVGYMLHPDHWRKGIVQEALTAVLDFGFNTLNLHSVEAYVNPDNDASIRLLEKNKFAREAYYKENYHFNGQFLDTAVYSLLRAQYH